MKSLARLIFFLPVVAGIAFLMFMVKGKQGPERPELAELSRTVKVVQVRPMTVIPTVTGYGYVQPTETWQAVPEVGGRIVEVHPELKKGTFVKKDDLLLRIDPESYGLAESRGQASVMNVDAQIRELEQQRINNKKLLDIEKKALQLTRQEVERKRKLYNKGYISASELEQEEKNLLAQQASVDNLVNALELIPSQIKAMEARKTSDVHLLSEARLDLEKTVIRAPYDCRISDVNIELYQYTPAGNALLSAVSISAVEIPVQLSPAAFISLVSPMKESVTSFFDTDFDFDRIREKMGISAKVRLPLFNRQAEWDGVFRRTGESMDLSTGAVEIFVAVYDPYGKMIPGERPPLIPNMYTEVELQGKARDNMTVVPFHAIHEGVIYSVDENSRLAKREVEVQMVMGNMAVLADVLPENTHVITTDLVPAIEGMLLSPEVDEELTARINALDVKKEGE